jgi:hypothetical protein
MDSFIVKLWGGVLNALRWLSPFHLAGFVFPRAATTYGFVDGWVIAHFLVAVCAWLLISPECIRLLAWLVLGYGALRLFEIVTYTLSVLFLDSLATNYALRSFRRSVILTLHNYCEVFFWFAAVYRHFAGHFGDKAGIVASADGALYYSMVTMATVGYGDITPQDRVARYVAITHIGVSIFLTLVVLARFVALLPTPETLDQNEKR